MTKTSMTKTSKTKQSMKKTKQSMKKTEKTARRRTRKKSEKQQQLDREFAQAQTLKKSGKTAAQLDSEIAKALGRDVGGSPYTGGLPMVQVRMDNGRPQVQAAPFRTSPPPSPPPQKSTVTILIVTQVYHRSDEPTRTLTIVFASRERALDAMKLHLTNPDADTTLNLRTLAVI